MRFGDCEQAKEALQEKVGVKQFEMETKQGEWGLKNAPLDLVRSRSFLYFPGHFWGGPAFCFSPGEY